MRVASSRFPIDEFQLKKELPETSTSMQGLLATDDKTFSSFDALDKLWTLTRLHTPFGLTQNSLSCASRGAGSCCPLAETFVFIYFYS